MNILNKMGNLKELNTVNRNEISRVSMNCVNEDRSKTTPDQNIRNE